MFCPKCGVEVRTDAKFCVRCAVKKAVVIVALTLGLSPSRGTAKDKWIRVVVRETCIVGTAVKDMPTCSDAPSTVRALNYYEAKDYIRRGGEGDVDCDLEGTGCTVTEHW